MISTAAYGMEVQVLNGGEILKLERWHTKCLRQILREPAMITRENNDEVRRKTRSATIESRLRKRRLLFWKSC